jgi:hypothetical protein
MQGIFNISQTYSLVSRFMLEASNESTGWSRCTRLSTMFT